MDLEESYFITAGYGFAGCHAAGDFAGNKSTFYRNDSE